MDYSPLLSLFTAVFEIIAALWIVTKKGSKSIIYTSSIILLLLAGYQILEVAVCTYGSTIMLSKIAFIVVTWLPPLGVLLISFLYPKEQNKINFFSKLLFFAGLAMIIWIAVGNTFVTQTVCSIVYAQYTTPNPAYLIYSAYYWVGLLSMVLLSFHGFKRTEDKKKKYQLKMMGAGTIAFVLPSLIVAALASNMKGALASVMCHFALFLAVFIVFLARYENNDSSEKTKQFDS